MKNQRSSAFIALTLGLTLTGIKCSAAGQTQAANRIHQIAVEIGANTEGVAAETQVPLVVAAVAQISQGSNNGSDTKEWVKNHLWDVYKSPWIDDRQDELLIALGLLSDDEYQAIYTKLKERWKGNNVQPPKPEHSRALATKVVAGLRQLQSMNLVVVQRGSMSRDNIYWDRTGVMSRADFEKTFKVTESGRMGHNLVGSSCYQDKDGTIYINCDYRATLDFLEFSYKYDETTNSWTPKYGADTLEATAVRHTEEVLNAIYAADPYYKSGERVRYEITKKLPDFVKSVQSASPSSAGDAINKLVEQTITEINEGKKVYGHPVK